MDSVDTVLDELSHLQNVLEQAKSWHSTKREMTFFDTALRKHYENPTTELLSFFLNSENEHGLHGVFYQGLLAALAADGTADWNADAWGDVQCVQTEVVTDKGRIDLLIETDRAVLAIECKIGHHQNNPFVDYQQYVQKNYAKEDTVLLILCVDGKSHIKDWTGVFQAIPDFRGTKCTASSTDSVNPCGVLSTTSNACCPVLLTVGATKRPPTAN